MAQTSGAVAQGIANIEVSFNKTTWHNIGGTSQSVTGADQERQVGDAYTVDGDTAVSSPGKRTPMDLEFNILYTEISTEAYELIRAQFEDAGQGSVIYVRYVPKGGTTGTNAMYRTPILANAMPALLTSFRYPMFDASTAGPIMSMFRVHTPYLEKTSASNTSGGSGT
jgi:hypothetical protein